MFMKWVEEKLCPAFKKFCETEFGEQRKMILVLDNAPYHHNRGVKSLSALENKAELVQLMKDTLLDIGRITHITLPAVAGKREDPLRIKIEDIDGTAHAQPNLPQVPTVKELETIWLEHRIYRFIHCSLLRLVSKPLNHFLLPRRPDLRGPEGGPALGTTALLFAVEVFGFLGFCTLPFLLFPATCGPLCFAFRSTLTSAHLSSDTRLG